MGFADQSKPVASNTPHNRAVQLSSKIQELWVGWLPARGRPCTCSVKVLFNGILHIATRRNRCLNIVLRCPPAHASNGSEGDDTFSNGFLRHCHSCRGSFNNGSIIVWGCTLGFASASSLPCVVHHGEHHGVAHHLVFGLSNGRCSTSVEETPVHCTTTHAMLFLHT